MAWWIWVLLAFLILGGELFSGTLHIGLFAVGALAVALLSGLGLIESLWIQLALFSVISVVVILWVRPMLVRQMKLNSKRDVDPLVGEIATALDEIAVDAFGKAEMRGTSWNAKNIGLGPLTKGQRCVVERIEGLSLWIRAQ